MKRAPLALAAAFLVSAPSLAQTPAGSEFRVNTATTGNQSRPMAAALDGTFVVTWASDSQGGDVLGQIVDGRGARVGAEFRISDFTTGRQWLLDVDRAPGGRFVVSWESAVWDGFYGGVAARVFQGAGAPVTPDLLVNTYTTGQQGEPSIASDAAGNFVVVWNSYLQDGSSWGVFGQRFDARGARRGAEFRVNSTTAGMQFSFYGGAVAMDAAGRFVVVWDGDGHVRAQRLAPDGARLGAEFQVDASPGGHGVPAVDSYARRGLRRHVVGTHEPGKVAQRFAADGAPVGSELQVVARPGSSPSVHGAGRRGQSGVHLVGRKSVPADRAFFRRFAADGTPRGGEPVPVNTAASGEPCPHVASDRVGNLLACAGSNSRKTDIWARRFGGLVPRPLTLDTAGNGVWEPGEAVDVRPSWRNDNGSALAFGGSFSAVTGPAGATYATTDGTGDYGTVPDATTAACTDCLRDLRIGPRHSPGHALGRFGHRGHHTGRPRPDAALAAPPGRQLRRRPPRQRLLPLRRDAAAPRRDRRLLGHHVLPPGRDVTLPDGRSCPGGEGRRALWPSALRDAPLQRRARRQPVLPVDRGAGPPRRGGRMRRRQLLPGRRRHPRADGGVRPADARSCPQPAGLHDPDVRRRACLLARFAGGSRSWRAAA